MGYRAVIAPSFGNIFFSNCFKNGVLPIVLAEPKVEALAQMARAGGEIAIDLTAQAVSAGGATHNFEVSPLRKEALSLGLDDLGVMLRRQDAIAAFESRDRTERPWVYL